MAFDFLLVTQLSFPNEVVPHIFRSQFLEMYTSNPERAEQIANACANGPAIDSLVILPRLLLALGLDLQLSRQYELFKLAFHEFGRSMVDDYIVKGLILVILCPYLV